MKDLAKKKLDQFSKELEVVQAAFQAEVEILAEKARVEILPYFKKHRLSFVADVRWGWRISKPSADTTPYYREEDHIQDEDLPQHIRELLNLEVAYNNQLGLHIRRIKRGEW